MAESNVDTEFETRMNDMVATAYATMGIALGQTLGLFEVLATFDEAVTAKQIADKADCKERYIEEWLRLMVVSDIVELQDDRYFLPKNRLATLTSTTNLVSYAPVLPHMSDAHKKLLDCFKKTGPLGFPYSVHANWFPKWSSMRPEYFQRTIPIVLSQVPGLREKLENGIQVCELCCGNGSCLIVMATLFPKSTFIGFDIDEDLIADGKAKVKEIGLLNVELVAKDCTSFADEYVDHFEFIHMSESLHDVAYPVKMLTEAYRVLKPGCYISVDDVNIDEDIKNQMQDKTSHQFCYMFSLYYCLGCQLQFPGAIGSGTCVGKQNVARWVEEAGFKGVKILDMEGNEGQVQLIGLKE